MTHRSFVILTILLVGLATQFSDAQDTPAAAQTAESLASRAAQLLAEGERAWSEDPERAEAALREGAALLEAAQTESGARNAQLERTLGAAHLLLDDTGKAVLHLRRAQRLDPTSPAIQETLDAARARVGAAPPPDANERAKHAVLFWRGFVPRWTLLLAAGAAWLLAWSLLLARRLGAHALCARLGLASLAISLVPAGALASEEVITSLREDAVVTQRGVTARNGPSADVYPATFTEPVQPGLEVVVLDRRDAWTRVRLASGQQTWLPDTAVEPVTPRRASR